MHPEPGGWRRARRASTLFLMIVANTIAADAPPALQIRQKTLKNGLRIVAAEDRSRPVINLQVWYHVGSKDEKPGRTGFAHLFEHMMFRGSKNVGPEEHMRLVRQAGGVVNAYTNFDTTVYWETFPSNYLERMLWLEADRMATLDVSEENFHKEREVVKEERRLRVENPPYGNLLEEVLRNTYVRYPYKHSPIGSAEDLDRATLDDVRAFHSLYYVPNNATVVLVGDFDTSEAFRLAERHFGAIPRGRRVPRVRATEPEQKQRREASLKDPKAPLDAVVGAYHLPPAGHPDSYALEIASTILSAGQSSRLYRKLVYEEQAALAAQGEALLLEGPSIFFAYAIANPGKDIRDILAKMEAIFAEMAEKPVTEAELEKAKNQILASFILERESMQAKADFLGKCAVLLNDPLRYNSELDRYRRVTAADVRRAVRTYLSPQRQTRVFIHPAADAGK
jgi:zinc protease